MSTESNVSATGGNAVAAEVETPSCRNCKHYVPTGLENSGLHRPDGSEWHYPIGRCALPVALGCPSSDHVPSWSDCHRHKNLTSRTPGVTNLWRFNATTGYWVHARACNPETAERWLAFWRRDEPGVAFRLAKRKPTSAPMPMDYGLSDAGG